MDAALAEEWQQCREFCNTFDLNYEVCVEFAGDYLLRQGKVTQAIRAYNTVRMKPIRTALKLAMYGHSSAMMNLCAMALKMTYILNSKYLVHPIIRSLLPDITYRHSEDVRKQLDGNDDGDDSLTDDKRTEQSNSGIPCSDFLYNSEDGILQTGAGQLSPSSQFHLANLLLISLAEKAVMDKNYIPLWYFWI